MRVRSIFVLVIVSILALVISGCGLGNIGTELGMKMAGIGRDLNLVKISKGSRVIIFTSEPGFSGYTIKPLGDRLDTLEVEHVFPADVSVYVSGVSSPRKMIKDMLDKAPADYVVMITVPRGMFFRAISLTTAVYHVTVFDSSTKTLVDTEAPVSEVGATEDDLASWLRSNLNIL